MGHRGFRTHPTLKFGATITVKNRSRMMTNTRFNVGEFDVLMIHDGGAPRPAGGWLASAPKDELEQVVKAHGLDPEAVDSSITPIVINTGSELVLIDSGLGGE